MYDWQKRKLKRELGDLYDTFLDYECYLAGGAITSIFTNKDINDYDIFFKHKKDIVRFLNKESYITNFKSDYAITITKNGKTIQLIYKHEYPTAQDVLNLFDFSVCMGCYDFSTEEFVLGDAFLEDLASKTIHFNPKTDSPIMSFIRIKKYINKGYDIPVPEMFKLGFTISQQNVDSYDKFQSLLGGMYGENYNKFAKKLKNEGKPFDLNYVVSKLSEIDDADRSCGCTTELDFSEMNESEISMEVGIPFDYFEYDDEYYTLDFKLLDKEDVDKCLFARKRPIEEIVKLPMTVYKWIDAKNRCSFFNSNFKWKDYGEVKTNDWFASSHGLHFVTEDKIWTCCYSNNSNKALVRGIVTSYDDFISINDMNVKNQGMKLKRVFVTNIWNEEDIPEEIKSKKKDKQEDCTF